MQSRYITVTLPSQPSSGPRLSEGKHALCLDLTSGFDLWPGWGAPCERSGCGTPGRDEPASGDAFAPNGGLVWSALTPRLNVLLQEVFVRAGVVLRLKGLGGGWEGALKEAVIMEKGG